MASRTSSTAGGGGAGGATASREEEEEEEGKKSMSELTISLRDETPVYFRVKKTTKMGIIMRAYCTRQGVEFNAMRFMYDGMRLVDMEITIEDLSIEDGDEVEVMVELRGD